MFECAATVLAVIAVIASSVSILLVLDARRIRRNLHDELRNSAHRGEGER